MERPKIIDQETKRSRRGFALTICVLLNTTATLFAQTDSALGFFPLHQGDIHQFHYHYNTLGCLPPWTPITHSSHHIEQIAGDTLLPTGFRYSIVWSDVPEDNMLRYLRVDSVSANVYEFQEYPSAHEILIDSLRATTGDWFHAGMGWMVECTGVETVTILGVSTTVKHFRSHYIHGDRYSIAYGFGRIKRITYIDHPCYAVLIDRHQDIVFSRINGQEHGEFVSVDDQKGHVPTHFDLGQNFPNPFNPTTTIEISMPQTRYVNLRVFDLLGQEVATLVADELQPGKHKIQWNAAGVTSGVYFYRLRAGDVVQTRRLIVLK